jgi:hypothetical protein
MFVKRCSNGENEMNKEKPRISKYGIYFQDTIDDEKERLVVKSMLDLMENDPIFKKIWDQAIEDADIWSYPTDDAIREYYNNVYLPYLKQGAAK